MSPKNAFLLRMGAHVPASSAVSVPSSGCVCPQTVNECTPPQPSVNLPDSAFNNLSLSDRLFLQTTRHSDPLHRSDILASTHRRARGLVDYVKQNGPEAFKQNYK